MSHHGGHGDHGGHADHLTPFERAIVAAIGKLFDHLDNAEETKALLREILSNQQRQEKEIEALKMITQEMRDHVSGIEAVVAQIHEGVQRLLDQGGSTGANFQEIVELLSPTVDALQGVLALLPGGPAPAATGRRFPGQRR